MIKKYKKLILLGVYALVTLLTFGQRSLGPTVISSFGSDGESNSFILSQTVGELMTQTFNGTSGDLMLTQGFHQDWIYVPNTGIESEDVLVGKVYPNPTRGMVYLDAIKTDNKIIRVDVIDITGKMLKTDVLDLRFGNSISLLEFQNGIYLIRMSDTLGKQIQTCKIEKTQ